MPIKDFTLALLVVMIWGISFSVVKVGLAELPPFLFSALRFLVIALAAFFVPAPRNTHWVNIVAVGLLLGVVKFGLLFIAMDTEVSAGSAALLLQTQVFFTLALGILIVGEKLSCQQTVGASLALIGLALFVTVREGAASPLGVSLVLLAAFTWACVNLLMKRMGAVNLLHMMTWASLVPIIPLFLLSAAVETADPLSLIGSMSIKAWLAVLYMGLLSTLTAYALWGGLLARHHAIKVAPFALLIPLIAIASSGLFLGETLRPQEIAGMSTILLGIALCMLPGNIVRTAFPTARPEKKTRSMEECGENG